MFVHGNKEVRKEISNVVCCYKFGTVLIDEFLYKKIFINHHKTVKCYCLVI